MTTQTTKIHPEERIRAEGVSRSPELRVGMVLLGRYEITAVLGSSELGEICCCLDRETGQEVSLRLLSPDIRRSKAAMAVIHAAIRQISNQAHPHLAAVRQLVYVGDQIYVVGDFAPGVDIGTWGREGEGGKRMLEEVLPILAQAAEALDFAHARRIIHSNLKPSNLYLGSDGVVRVTDFGLGMPRHMTIVHGEAVRASTTGAYLAPELRNKEEDSDSATDQYALAVLAWEVLAGAPPASGAEPPPELPSPARAALRRAMSKKPRNRFVTCTDFVRALGGERVGGRRGRSAAEWRRIRKVAILLGTLAAIGTALALGGRTVLAWLREPPRPPEEPAAEKEATAARPPAPKKPVRIAPEKLVATTPLPTEGQPWVTQTGRMEFVWVPPMQMWIGRYEVANDEYRLMDPAHDSGEFRGISLKEDRQPVVRVNFDDTEAFASWLTERERAAGKLMEGWRYRLPSRLEAIAYTRGGQVQTYPWGELWPPNRGNYGDGTLGEAFPDLQFISGYEDGFAATAPVEFSGENRWGLFGAGGNVWETTSKEAGWKQFGGWQGGGWDDYLATRMKCDMLYGFLGNARGAVNGFRLVLAPVAGETPPPPPPAAAAAPAAPQS